MYISYIFLYDNLNWISMTHRLCRDRDSDRAGTAAHLQTRRDLESKDGTGGGELGGELGGSGSTSVHPVFLISCVFFGEDINQRNWGLIWFYPQNICIVYNGKSYWNRWFGGTPISGNLHILGRMDQWNSMSSCWNLRIFCWWKEVEACPGDWWKYVNTHPWKGLLSLSLGISKQSYMPTRESLYIYIHSYIYIYIYIYIYTYIYHPSENYYCYFLMVEPRCHRRQLSTGAAFQSKTGTAPEPGGGGWVWQNNSKVSDGNVW